MLLSELGQRIRSQRERLGLKQHDIAHALQISPQAVSKWERGENGPDLAILGTLAKLLGVSTDWLLHTHGESLEVFEATVFATSVIGAYEKSLAMTARDFAIWANGFFYPLTEAVLRHGGVPIKYMGDDFLGFFSGSEHPQRAARTALLSKRLIAENLVIGFHSGEIYLGTMGHPDYARPDIMGEVVNVAFLTRDWAKTEGQCRIAVTTDTAAHLHDFCDIGPTFTVNFLGINKPAQVCELRERT